METKNETDVIQLNSVHEIVLRRKNAQCTSTKKKKKFNIAFLQSIRGM